MLLVEMFSWWYSVGLVAFQNKLKHLLLVSSDFFSLSILLKTLFNPYRQIVGRATNSSTTGMFQAIIDTMVSRFIGLLIRSTTLIVGGIAITIQLLTSVIAFAVWLLLPLVPLTSIILFFEAITR